jgi:hypothetical protein
LSERKGRRGRAKPEKREKGRREREQKEERGGGERERKKGVREGLGEWGERGFPWMDAHGGELDGWRQWRW